MAAILIVGAAAYIKLPISALPEVEYPTIQVRTFYPGASPDVMSSAVTAPLERQFGQIPGLTQMTSTSSDGSSAIVLQFSLRLNIDVAEQEVQAAINAAQSFLPTDLPVPPIYSKSNPADAPVLTLALTSKTLPLPKVEDLADSRLAPKISQLSGVGLVTIGGGQKPAVRIQVNPATLATYGINLEDLRTALASTSVNAAKGTIDGEAQNYQINSNDQLLAGDDYRDVIVAYKNGAPVTLSDVSKISDGVENVRLAGWMNQTPAVILNIQRQPGANTIAVVKSIEDLLPQLRANLPASVKLTVLTDRTTTIRASVEDVEFELVLTIGLVVMVIFIFLRNLYATIIPAIAIPISLVGALAVMYLLGYSLNNLTLMALTISTGFVVDDAIVMIENISRYLEQGLRPLEAALKGAEQIGFTIISLTISLIAVLIPLLLMGDIVGRLFREFAITLAVTILISAAVSLTLTPTMSARLLRHKPESEQGRFYRWSERMFETLVAQYSRTLHWILRHEISTLLVAAATLALAIYLYVVIPKGLFPTQDVGIIQGISQAPESTSFQAMSRKQQDLAKAILQDPAVASLSSFIGVDGTNATLNSGRIQINLKPFSQRGIDATAVIDRLQSRLQKVDVSWEPDLWGRVRNMVHQFSYAAQVSAADLENEKLTEQANLAVFYFDLRGQDALEELFRKTVEVDRQSLELTRVRYRLGLDNDEAVAQAEIALEGAEAAVTNTGIARAQFEHAIATLVGEPASAFSVPVRSLTTQVPHIPAGIPSDLLERRPDIASAERTMEKANALIGVGKAGYYPPLSITGPIGFEATKISKWLPSPSR